MVDFVGGATPASRRTQELTEALSDSARLIRSAEAAKNRAYHELEMERTRKRESLKQQADMLLEVARARGRVGEGGEMMEDDMAGAGGGQG